MMTAALTADDELHKPRRGSNRGLHSVSVKWGKVTCASLSLSESLVCGGDVLGHASLQESYQTDDV